MSCTAEAQHSRMSVGAWPHAIQPLSYYEPLWVASGPSFSVIRDEPYNEKVDVFSFGVVLYEVFGRTLLLEMYGKEELEVLSARVAQGFRHHRPDLIPAAVWDIVQQCWAQVRGQGLRGMGCVASACAWPPGRVGRSWLELPYAQLLLSRRAEAASYLISGLAALPGCCRGCGCCGSTIRCTTQNTSREACAASTTLTASVAHFHDLIEVS